MAGNPQVKLTTTWYTIITMTTKRKLTAEEKEAYSIIGRRRGLANVKKNGKKHMSEIGKKGAESRYGKKKDN